MCAKILKERDKFWWVTYVHVLVRVLEHYAFSVLWGESLKENAEIGKDIVLNLS